jgi:flagellar M-ring protein FliF
MKNDQKDPLARGKALWDGFYHGLGEAQRRRLWLGLGTALMLGGLIAAIAGRTQWSVLYTGLQARDAGAITEKLKAAKVPYRLTEDGTAIEVPAGAVYEQRLSLATQGLPQGQDRGYELLDENNLMVSEESAKVNRVRALQGELERTILSMNGIEGVRVHLVIPDHQMFTKDAQSSSASVLLKLQPGFLLDDSQAAALALLVSHAVDGLKPEAVAIVDTDGNDLGPGTNGGAAQVGTRVDAARKVEKHLHDQVQSLFDEALGPKQAIVRVHAELDFNDQTVTKDLYEAPSKQGGLVREESSDTSNQGRGGGGGATAIVASNGGAPVASSTGGGDRGSSSNTRRVVYELNHTVENITQNAGSLKRVSVAVILKQAFAPAELEDLKAAVQQTVGLDPTRGDVLSLAVVPGKVPAAADLGVAKALQQEGADQRRMMLLSLFGPWAVMVLAVLALTALAWKALRMIFSLPLSPEPRGEAPGQGSVTQSQLADADLSQLVERNPSSAAQVLRRMMNN